MDIKVGSPVLVDGHDCVVTQIRNFFTVFDGRKVFRTNSVSPMPVTEERLLRRFKKNGSQYGLFKGDFSCTVTPCNGLWYCYALNGREDISFLGKTQYIHEIKEILNICHYDQF